MALRCGFGVTHGVEAGLALKEKACLKQHFFSSFLLLLEASVGGPACAFPPSCRDQAPHRSGAEALLGALELFKNTLSRPTRITPLVGPRVRIASLKSHGKPGFGS